MRSSETTSTHALKPMHGAANGKAGWSKSGKTNLFSLDRASLEKYVTGLGEKPFRARQLLQWIYRKGVIDFDAMSDLSRATRQTLSEHAALELPSIEFDSTASDGTRKWLFGLGDGNSIETVYIPELSLIHISEPTRPY